MKIYPTNLMMNIESQVWLILLFFFSFWLSGSLFFFSNFLKTKNKKKMAYHIP